MQRLFSSIFHVSKLVMILTYAFSKVNHSAEIASVLLSFCAANPFFRSAVLSAVSIYIEINVVVRYLNVKICIFGDLLLNRSHRFRVSIEWERSPTQIINLKTVYTRGDRFDANKCKCSSLLFIRFGKAKWRKNNFAAAVELTELNIIDQIRATIKIFLTILRKRSLKVP
jgi:hypothetical protein